MANEVVSYPFDGCVHAWWVVYCIVPPVIEPRLQSEYVVKEGSTLRVLCEATGRPAPQIVWRRPDSNGSYTDDPLLSDLVSLISAELVASFC